MLEYAATAPSGHNAQPWTVRISGDALSIGSPKVDAANRELALSAGAFVENLLAAAPGCGYAAACEVTGVDAGDGELVRVSLEKIAAQTAPLAQIRARRTMREGQQSRPLSAADARALTSHFADGAASFASPESGKAGCSPRAPSRPASSRPPGTAPSANFLPGSAGRARKGADRGGLTPESMEIGELPGWCMRHFMDRAGVLTLKFRERGVDRARRQVASRGG